MKQKIDLYLEDQRIKESSRSTLEQQAIDYNTAKSNTSQKTDKDKEDFKDKAEEKTKF